MEGIKIKPLFDNVVVEELKEEEQTSTGIIVRTEDATVLAGRVLAVGKEVEEEIKVGDTIAYAPFSGRLIAGYLLLGQHDIMGIIEK